jgi:hypothetical protein
MADIPIKFVADTKSFEKGLKKAFAGAALAAAAAAVAFVKIQQAIADSTNAITDASLRTGIAAETLNGLRLAAEGAGLGFSSIEKALKNLPKSIREVASGSGIAKDAFASLGVEAKNADGTLRDSDAVFNDIIGSLADVASTTEQAALATDIFGGAGTKLLQALGGNLGSLDKFVELSNKYGISVGPEASASAAQWQRQMALTKDVMRGAAQSMLDFGGDTTDVFGIIQIAIVVVTEDIKGLAGAVGFWLSRVASFWKKVFTGDFRGAVDTAAEAITGFIPKVTEAFEKGQKAGEEFAVLREQLNNVATATKIAGTNTINYNEGLKKTIKLTKEVSSEIAEHADLFGRLMEVQLDLQRARASDPVLFDIEKEIEGLQELQLELQALGESTIEIEEAIQEKKDEINDHEIELFIERAEAAEKQADFDRRIHEQRLAFIRAERQAVAQAAADIIEAGAIFLGVAIDNNEQLAASIRQNVDEEGNLTAAQQERIDALQEETNKLFNQQKGIAIGEVVVNAAVAISKAFATLGPIGGAAATAGILAMGAAQTAMIQAQEPPSLHDGGVIGDEVDIRALTGESVLNRDATGRLGESGVNALNRGQEMPIRITVPMVYEHRIFNSFVIDNIKRGGPLSSAISTISTKVGHRDRAA